ncbi:MAG: hypothetical protein ACFFAQ_01600 [Promethearchaeota archaeon]
MKRLKSIDIFRGMGMIYIMVGHMIDWWTTPKDSWLFYIYVSLFSAILTINTNIWWLIYSLGIELLLFLILLGIEEFEFIKTERSYRFLYYFSYYSLTLFLIQNINFFLFYGILNRYNIWFFIIGTVILYSLLLRFLFKKLGPQYSLKSEVRGLAVSLAGRFEIKRKNRIT